MVNRGALPVRVLSRLFRRLFLKALETAFDQDRLKFFGDLQPLSNRQNFLDYLAPLSKCEWVVYAKPVRPYPCSSVAIFIPLGDRARAIKAFVSLKRRAPAHLSGRGTRRAGSATRRIPRGARDRIRCSTLKSTGDTRCQHFQ